MSQVTHDHLLERLAAICVPDPTRTDIRAGHTLLAGTVHSLFKALQNFTKLEKLGDSISHDFSSVALVDQVFERGDDVGSSYGACSWLLGYYINNGQYRILATTNRIIKTLARLAGLEPFDAPTSPDQQAGAILRVAEALPSPSPFDRQLVALATGFERFRAVSPTDRHRLLVDTLMAISDEVSDIDAALRLDLNDVSPAWPRLTDPQCVAFTCLRALAFAHSDDDPLDSARLQRKGARYAEWLWSLRSAECLYVLLAEVRKAGHS